MTMTEPAAAPDVDPEPDPDRVEVLDTPAGRCCDNGIFGQEHDCQKQPGHEGALLPAVREERRHLVPGTDLPIIPAAGELRDLAAMSVTLAGAAAVPKALQNKPNDVFQVLLTARDLGVAVTTAMREFHVIDGRVTLSPKVKLAMVNERGARDGWAVWPDPGNDENKATWYATRRDRPGLTFSSTFTMDEAKVAKLAAKSNWETYPKRMLSWRALGYLLDDVFPEVATGLYSPDELGGITDEEGRIIDVATADPLPGTNGLPERPPDPTTTIAPEGERFMLACRIASLPDESRAVLRERWLANSSTKGRTLDELPVTAARAAGSLVAAVEREAQREGWDIDEAHRVFAAQLQELAGTAAVGAQGAPVEPEGADAGPEPEPGAQPATGRVRRCLRCQGHIVMVDDVWHHADATTNDHDVDPVLTEAEVIAAVKGMMLPNVDSELKRLHRDGQLTGVENPTGGDSSDRRARLVLARLRLQDEALGK